MSLALAAMFAAEFVFGAYVDDRRIGEARFEVTERDDGIRMHGLAEFRVTVLRVPVFTYHHEVEELWRDGCLVELRSVTRSNREHWSVAGRIEDGAFVVERTHGDERRDRAHRENSRDVLDACVATYVYWDPRVLLGRQKLLNAQTGVYDPVTVTVTAGSGAAPQRIELEGAKFVIELDYADLRWIGLDTTTDAGRHLVYRVEESVKKRP